ncbi:MAG: ExeM/NucH family extracellular endonuclease [Pseudomonadota bacterium]
MLPNVRPAWLALATLFASAAHAQTPVFINEIHYDNDGGDTGEFVEVTAPDGTDLTAYTVVLYNGANGTSYNTLNFAAPGAPDGQQDYYLFELPTNGIQNGSPDGLALIDASGTVVQFLSYEGSFTASNGLAAGVTSTDIGVSESGDTLVGDSLQLAGTGTVDTDFAWQMPAPDTRGARNTNQVFESDKPIVFVSEFHYDNTGGDTGEAIEISGSAGTDLAGYSLVLYNGNGGGQYNTFPLTGFLPDESGGLGALSFATSGLQNGGPDGFAFVDPNGEVLEFLSYEGSFTAVDGPAEGLASTDVGVAEPSDTPVGESLQLTGCVTSLDELDWSGPSDDNFGELNFQLVGNLADCDEPPVEEFGLAFINEIHYDNEGADINEGFEIAVEAGVSLQGWEVVLYNGSNGATYNTVSLTGNTTNPSDGLEFLAITLPSNGLQNGAPDGIALVNPIGQVVQFLSYEGSFTAANGPAAGQSSIDIEVEETGSTPVGVSLQVASCDGTSFKWDMPMESTFGQRNTTQTSLSDATACLSGSGGGGGGGEPPEEPVTVLIGDIQGVGDATNRAGELLRFTGVVTGVTPALNGFFVQDAGDGKPASSDGIFVNGDTAGVAVGDIVTIIGNANEDFGQTEFDATSIVAAMGVNIPFPAPVNVSFPVSLDRSELESLEGMLVTVSQQMTVTDLFGLSNFGELLLSADGRKFQYTQNTAPTSAAAFDSFQAEEARSLIILDDLADGSLDSPRDGIFDVIAPYPAPGLSETENRLVRIGDTVTGFTGNLGFGFGQYRVRPTEPFTINNVNLRPEVAPDVGGRLKIVSFNVENFFNTEGGRGASNAEELSIQIDKLVLALSALDADVYGLIELENDSSEGASSSIAELTAALNAANATSCGMNYSFLAKTEADPSEDEIAVGLIFCASTVAQAPGTELAVLNDTVLTEIGLFTRPLFNDFRTNRTPIAATFEERATGERFTVTVNHFKSKGSGGSQGTIDEDAGDGAGAFNAMRTEASLALLAWLDTAPTGSDDPDIAILGDLNAYAFETPITALEMAGFEDLAKRTPFSYGFVFRGASGTLDYILTSTDLSPDVTGFDEWHINADEPPSFEYPQLLANRENPFRISDHDPAIAGIDLDDTIAPEIASCGTPDSGTIRPWNRGIKFTADVSDRQDAHPDVEITDVRCKRVFRRFTWPFAFCRVSTAGDTIKIRRPGGLRNRISWTVNATDATGNASSKQCSVDVTLPRRRH